MKILFSLFCTFIICVIHGRAEIQQPDSLRNAIKQCKSDSCIIKAYLSKAAWYEKVNTDSAEHVYMLAASLAEGDIIKYAGDKDANRHYQKLLADVYSKLGELYVNQVKIIQSLDYDYKSLKIREQLNDTAGIAEVLNDIAVVHYYYLQDQAHALDFFLKGLRFIQAVHDKYGEAVILHNVADIYEKQGDTLKALDYYQRSLKMREEIGDKQAISNGLSSLSSTYRELGNIKEAFDYGNRCFAMRKEIGDKRGIAYAEKGLGEIYFVTGDLKKAKELGMHALQTGKQIGNPDVIEKSAFFLQKIYKHQGLWKDAYEMNQLYMQMHDSTSGKTNGLLAIRQQVNYEYEKRAIADSLKFLVAQRDKDLKIEQQQAMLSKERILRNSIIVIALLILVILAVVTNYIRAKNKTAQSAKMNDIRKKISRDLHDEIGAGLTSISMICEQARMKSRNKPAENELTAFSERIRLQTRGVYEKLREVIWATNPENDNLEVLISYMRNYVSNFFDPEKVGTSISYKLNLPDDVPRWELKPDVSRNLIFVLKEALNNSAKHSNANCIDVSFSFTENKNYSFKICDNGKGIDFDTLTGTQNGLSFMRKRIEEINGKFRIISSPGRTEIEISGNFS